MRTNLLLAASGALALALAAPGTPSWAQTAEPAPQPPAAGGPAAAVDAETVDYMVVVAPLNSVYQDMPTLVDKMKNDPTEAVWAGGPVGSASHAAVGQVAQALGVDPAKVIYKAFPNEAEAAAGIAGGQADVAMLPLSAVAERAEEGNVRILAIASEAPLQGLAVPTLREQGIDVVAQGQ